MRVLALLLLMLLSLTAQADWLGSVQAYENKQYAVAKAGFQGLVPLGNADAAFNLGVMAYYGEGQAVDLGEALSYFLLAEQLEHQQAAAIVKRIYQEASTEQRAQAEQAAAKMLAGVFIKKNAARYQLSSEREPVALNAPMPDVPDDVFRRHPIGYIVLQLLVNEQGRVVVVDAIDSFPEGIFEPYTFRILQRWQFEATGKQHLVSRQINFWVPGAMNARGANQLLSHQQLWQYAQAGSQRHQEVLGSALNLIRLVSGVVTYLDPASPELEQAPDLSAWFEKKKLEIAIPGFQGDAIVQTNSQGQISRLLDVEDLKQPEAETLLGLKIKGAGEGVFSLSGRQALSRSFSRLNQNDLVLVQQYFPVHPMQTAWYWWQKAASNGNLRAQRIMGAQRQDWQFYLLQQQDPMASAWHGARLVLDGETKEGKALLQQSQAAGYKPAAELLKAMAL